MPSEAIDACVPLDSLYRVLHHGESAKGDSHRFSVTADPEDATSRVFTPLPLPPMPSEAIDTCVPLDSLYRVLHHGESAKGDSHRFSVTADPEDATSRVSSAPSPSLPKPQTIHL